MQKIGKKKIPTEVGTFNVAPLKLGLWDVACVTEQITLSKTGLALVY